MRIFLWASAGWLLSVQLLSAQVSVDVVLPQDQYLRDESLSVVVRITNRSGQTLRLGQEDWLTFTVENLDGGLVSQKGQPRVGEPFALGSADVAQRRVDLMPYYDLSRNGRYRITAHLRIEDWGREVSSKPKRFDIGQGSKIWEQEFGVPSEGGPPEVRKYSLVAANYLKRPLLYVRVTDPGEHRVYEVRPIGPLVSFSKPEHLLDKESNLHVLFQTGARSFTYSVINPRGALIVRQMHFYFRTRPELMVRNGAVEVSGGVRQVSADDIPAANVARSTDDVKAPTP